MDATYDDIVAMELRRLAELEKQAAIYGPKTDPAVLVEIQDLRYKHGYAHGRFVRSPGLRDRAIDYDFLMNAVAAALRRISALEEHNQREAAIRPRRQMNLNIWLGAISAVVLFNALFLLYVFDRLLGV